MRSPKKPPQKTKDYLSESEKILWQKVTENVTRINSNQAATPLVRKSVYVSRASHYYPIEQFNSAPVTSLSATHLSLRDSDHNWHQKLRRGKVKPEGTIDLHGMSQDRAFSSLARYIEEAQRRGKRFILVVTGKGGQKSKQGEMSYSDYSSSRGILKTNVPRWLSQGELSLRIVSYHSANKEDGGDGALYVILKKLRG